MQKNLKKKKKKDVNAKSERTVKILVNFQLMLYFSFRFFEQFLFHC